MNPSHLTNPVVNVVAIIRENRIKESEEKSFKMAFYLNILIQKHQLFLFFKSVAFAFWANYILE